MHPRARVSAAADERLVCRWDLDKTYLQSEFETLREMMPIAWTRWSR